ncbi:MAG: Osmoregulated proline transporter OpuE [Chlamydiae bacterium]|nr:Osmoregulated proline transporter OpuE [Chlamydiota bacterium]
MNVPLFIFLLSSLGVAFIWLGKKASGQVKSQEDYFLSGRSLGLFPLAMTLLATQLGGGVLMGGAEEAYRSGWVVICYPLGAVLGLLLLGLGFGAKLRRLNVTTIAEIFEKIYGSKRLRKVASILSIVSLFMILVGQGIASRKFFAALGFDGGILFSSFWLILVIYTVLGGLKAVVNTDILQACFILGAFALAFFSTLFGATPDPTTFVASAPQTSVPWLMWLLMPLLYMLIEQDMGQRCFAAKKPKLVSLGSCIAAAILLVACFCPIYFGTMAAKMGIEIPAGSSVLVTAVKALTSPTISTVLICAIMMAIISTADSLLCSISSNLSCDFSFSRKKSSVLASQAITFCVGMSALALTFFFDSVVGMLMFSYELAVSVLFIPITMAVLWKNPKKSAAIVSMVIGGISFFFFPAWITVPLAFTGFAATDAISFTRRGEKGTLNA